MKTRTHSYGYGFCVGIGGSVGDPGTRGFKMYLHEYCATHDVLALPDIAFTVNDRGLLYAWSLCRAIAPCTLTLHSLAPLPAALVVVT